MSTLIRIVIIVFVLMIVGGVAYLATGDLPAPRAPVEKVIPSDRFPQ